MLQDWLTVLTHAIEGAPAAALGAAAAWGVVSLLLSPCHLASIPLVVGVIGAHDCRTIRGAAGLSGLFAGGILISIAVVGGLTAAAGRMLGDVGPLGYYSVAGVWFVVGLHLIGVIELPQIGGAGGRVFARRSSAAVLGLVFGLALGPCTFAYMAPLLAVVFKVSSGDLGYGLALLAAFGVGHSAVIVAAGASSGWVQRWLHWSERSRGPAVVRAVCGASMLMGGVWLIYRAP